MFAVNETHKKKTQNHVCQPPLQSRLRKRKNLLVQLAQVHILIPDFSICNLLFADVNIAISASRSESAALYADSRALT